LSIIINRNFSRKKPKIKITFFVFFGNTVCGVDSQDQIFCKDDLYSSNWYQLTGGLKHVTVVDGVRLLGVNSYDMIYHNENFRQDKLCKK
jgi:hypothetical protein